MHIKEPPVSDELLEIRWEEEYSIEERSISATIAEEIWTTILVFAQDLPDYAEGRFPP